MSYKNNTTNKKIYINSQVQIKWAEVTTMPSKIDF